MRAPTSLAVFVASSLVQQSCAQQSGYGNPGAVGGGIPDGSVTASSNSNVGGPAYGSPVGSSSANSDGYQNGFPNNVPNGGSNGNPAGAAAGLPGTSPNSPSCIMQGTTTVFVTIYPTSPLNPSGIPGFVSSDPDQTVFQTYHPTTTVFVSPVASIQQAQSSVKPFTTLTIDLWGNDSDSQDNSGTADSGPSPAPSYTDSGAISRGPNSGSPPITAASAQAPWATTLPTVTAQAQGTIPNNQGQGTGDGQQPGFGGSASPALPEYNGAGGAPGSSGSDNLPSQITILGSDGLPTIVNIPPTQLGNGNTPQAASTAAGFPSLPISGPVGASGALPQAGEPTCTTYTIIGTDGVPTVVQSTWTAAQAGITAGPGNLPSGWPSPLVANSAEPNGIANNGAITTCTSYTILGANGLPIVVESTWLVPGPLNTQSALAAVTSGSPYPTAVGFSAQNIPTPPANPAGGSGVTTCTSFTVLGADGLPSIVESTWIIPNPTPTFAATANAVTGIPDQGTRYPGYPSVNSAATGNGVTTCTSYTVLGFDGLPTVVETSWVIPNPVATNVASMNAITGVPPLPTLFPGSPQPADISSGLLGSTICTSFTILGANGLPTVVESTYVVAASNALPAQTNVGYPSAVPQDFTGLPQGNSPTAVGNDAVTSCITVNVLGPDGSATPVVQTVLFNPTPAAAALPFQTSLGNPSLVSQQDFTGLPQGFPLSAPSQGLATTSCITLNVLGPDGAATPVVQTIVLPPFNTAPAVQAASALAGLPNGVNTAGVPDLNPYGAGFNTLQGPSIPPGAISGVGSGVAAASAIPAPANTGLSGQPPSYDDHDALGNASPASTQGQLPQNAYSSSGNGAGLGASIGDGGSSLQYGAGSNAGSQLLFSAVQTTTWTNVITEQTTTYTINFPVTTLATVARPVPFTPIKRAMRRQQSSLSSASEWNNSSSTPSDTFSINTSLAASLSSALLTSSTQGQSLPPAPTAAPAVSSVASLPSTTSICPTGGKIGNTTIDFDELHPGPLFNPSGDIWFSEGFVIAPPSSQASQAYVASSGGQLVEFVPPSLSPTPAASGTRDTAEIGVGPNAANSCFRFNFYGASLGCAAQGSEQWCEFEVSAYSYDQGLTQETSVAWSETKRVPACPTFPNGGCQLTPVTFDGYSNITSVLIKLHVGLDLRVWWGDDFKFGWSDNSCPAASCRANATPHRVKRETIESAARDGVWHWAPSGLERLDEEYIWDSIH